MQSSTNYHLQITYLCSLDIKTFMGMMNTKLKLVVTSEEKGNCRPFMKASAVSIIFYFSLLKRSETKMAKC